MGVPAGARSSKFEKKNFFLKKLTEFFLFVQLLNVVILFGVFFFNDHFLDGEFRFLGAKWYQVK